MNMSRILVNSFDNDGIIKSFCYWYGPMKVIQHLFFKSFLVQQPENFVLDVYVENCDNLQSFFSHYNSEELKRINIIVMNWDNITDKTLIYHDFNALKRDNLALLSDYCRILTFIKTTEYTFYFDMDICFLQSLVPFLSYGCFVYTWGRSESGNSAIIKSDANTSREFKRLLILNKTPHPLNMFKTPTDKVSILSCTMFDPQWLTDEFDLPFDDNDVKKNKMIEYINKYKSYAVHWHNRWNIIPESIPRSWIYMMYNRYVNLSPKTVGTQYLSRSRSVNLSGNKKTETSDFLITSGTKSEKVSNCTYGSNNNNIDVTNIFRTYFVRNEKLFIDKDVPFNGIFGDPLPGVIKRLRFRLNNSNYVVNEYRQTDIILQL